MKITVIATNDSENFPIGGELTIDSLVCRSHHLGLYEVVISSDVFSSQVFTVQTTKISVLSLDEIVVAGYFSLNVDGEKLAFLNLSVAR